MPPNVAVKPGNERHDKPVSESRYFHENLLKIKNKKAHDKAA